MNLPDLSWRLAALAASLLIHALIVLHWSDQRLISAEMTEQPPNALFVQIDFPQPRSQALMPAEEPPPQETVETPKPPPEPKPEPKPKPKPKPAPKPRPKPVEMPVEEPAKAEEVAEQAPPAAPAPPPAASRRLVDLRNEYLSRLLARIEKNKFYPTVARRRNLQGMVQVRFRLGCRGEVEELQIDGEHGLLRKAAGKAIEAAMPLPEIPAEIECPMLVDYAMAYTLEN